MFPLFKNIFAKAPRILKSNKRLFATHGSYEEIRIPRPWGIVAGKWWGPQDKRPILALHGWQDNCGSFDTLIPFLPEDIPILAIDMPGHGLSTRLPPGTFYHGIDIATFIRRLTQYFGWEKVSLLGHSLGAMGSFVYTMLFPKDVDLLICIDALHPFQHIKHKPADAKARIIDNFIKYDALSSSSVEPPSYTFPHMEHLLHKGTKSSIALDKCKYILKRNIAPSKEKPGHFYFTRDVRLKLPNLFQWQEHEIHEGSQRITCPLFLSLATVSPFQQLESNFLKTLDIIKKQNSNVEYHKVEGTHHLHLNTPERIAHLIYAFIKKYDEEDRSVGGIKEEIRI